MNKKLKKIFREATSSMVTYNEKFVRRDMSIPGLTIDGKDIKGLLDSKDFESFLREDAFHISFDETVLSNRVFSEQEKEAILSQFAGYSKDVKEYFIFNLSVIKKLISSINHMIPSDLHEDKIDVAETIKDTLQKMSYVVSFYDDCIQNKLLVLFEQEKETFGVRSISAKINLGFRLMKTMIDLNLITMRIPLLHQIVYEYFYGPTDKKDENAAVIKQLASNFDAINKTVNEMKENQIKANELIENRNKEEEVRILSRNYCARKIQEVIDKSLPQYSIDYESIMKNLRNWDKKLEKGQKVPVPGYASIKKSSPQNFIRWVKSDYIEYHLMNHENGRGRGRRKGSNQKKHRYSSSEAAQNEAARKHYEDKAK